MFAENETLLPFQCLNNDSDALSCIHSLSFFSIFPNINSSFSIDIYLFGGAVFKEKTEDLDFVIPNISMSIVNNHLVPSLNDLEALKQHSFPEGLPYVVQYFRKILSNGGNIENHYWNKVFGGYMIKMIYQGKKLDFTVYPKTLNEHEQALFPTMSAVYKHLGNQIIIISAQAEADFKNKSLNNWNHLNDIQFFNRLLSKPSLI